MITVDDNAKAFIDARCSEERGRCWYLIVEWRLGEMENFRAADGSSIWSRQPDKGWEVNLIGYGPEVDRELGEPLLPGVRIIVAPSKEHTLVGGRITFRDGSLSVEPHAA